MTPEDTLRRAAAVPATPAGALRLSGMLRQGAAPYRGLSTKDAEWLRAQLLALVAARGTPATVLPLLAEELATGTNPLALAAAARAIARSEETDPRWLPLLEAAEKRLVQDEYVSFRVDEPGGKALTAREELQQALVRFRPRARSCCGSQAEQPTSPAVLARDAAGIRCRDAFTAAMVEDQDGEVSSLAELTAGSRSLLALFYTRCMNPLKCSATVAALARLAAERERGWHKLRLIGLSYDPDFDSPARLKGYGLTRNFRFGVEARLVRCTRGWPSLRRELDLQVGYGDTTVNEHARELFFVEPNLTVRALDPAVLADPRLVIAATAVGNTR